MRDKLAERLLAEVMNWSDEDVATERPVLEALAELKYDEYQQFSPGMRFVESLARWLRQFEPEKRSIAYRFVRTRLVFFSEAEMSHFASIAYSDHIRPLLLKQAAQEGGISPYLVGKISSSLEFQKLQSTTLFCGLSDGARIDRFRRSNRELSHEQILPSYQVDDDKVSEIQDWFKSQGLGNRPIAAVVLLDDFAGSGRSCFRNDHEPQGKLVRFIRSVTKPESGWGRLISFPETAIVIVHYVATEQAKAQINEGGEWLREVYGSGLVNIVVQSLGERIRISEHRDDEFIDLIESYYDPSKEDEHTNRGGLGLKYGYDGCRLPLVLHHNTPNNSIYLLWAEDSPKILPLFPRFSRHRVLV